MSPNTTYGSWSGLRPQPKVRMRAPAEPPATCPCYEGGHDPVGDDTPNPPGPHEISEIGATPSQSELYDVRKSLVSPTHKCRGVNF